MRYGEIFHMPKVSELSRHISQLMSEISVLHTPWYIFPLINELPIVQDCNILASAKVKAPCACSIYLVTKLVAVNELEP